MSVARYVKMRSIIQFLTRFNPKRVWGCHPLPADFSGGVAPATMMSFCDLCVI